MWRLINIKKDNANAKNEIKIRCEKEIYPDGHW